MILFLLLFLVTAISPAQTGGVEVWAAPSVYKVRPHQPPQTSKSTSRPRWSSPRPPPPNRYQRAAAGFFVEASDLVSENARIPRDR